MSPKELPPVHETDVYALTEKGNRELHGAETSLSPQELELLVCVDGRSTVAQIASSVPSLAMGGVTGALRKLLRDGLIDLADQIKFASADFGDFFSLAPAQLSAKAISDADVHAATGVSSLQKQGYYVRIARRAAVERKPGGSEKFSVLVIEDEPLLAKFLRQYLALEGLEARIAANRAEIIAELRRAPLPSVVLLDVMLPDADGFDVLLKMRGHPVLKSVPVIMLTAKATREAVLMGLAGGADGYVTKPFEPDVLIKAVKAVLGLAN